MSATCQRCGRDRDPDPNRHRVTFDDDAGSTADHAELALCAGCYQKVRGFATSFDNSDLRGAIDVLETAAVDPPLSTKAAVDALETLTSDPHTIRQWLDEARKIGLVEPAERTVIG